jgi:hypothetical protein
VSIVDLAWITVSAARYITNWEVVLDTESLTDHRNIRIGVRVTPSEVLRRRAKRDACRQWALRKLDVDLLMAVFLAKSLASPREEESIRDKVKRIGATLTKASDVSMPRSRSFP